MNNMAEKTPKGVHVYVRNMDKLRKLCVRVILKLEGVWQYIREMLLKTETQLHSSLMYIYYTDTFPSSWRHMKCTESVTSVCLGPVCGGDARGSVAD
jgi:hypothetical protein